MRGGREERVRPLVKDKYTGARVHAKKIFQTPHTYSVSCSTPPMLCCSQGRCSGLGSADLHTGRVGERERGIQ